MTRTAGVDLADLADEPILDAPVPTFVAPTPRSLRLAQVAANPYNTRDLTADHAKVAEIAESMRKHGQLQACTVVSRDAFLRIYPEDAGVIGEDATHVQVMGGRRRAAALLAGLPTLDVVVKDHLAESRGVFVETTAAENLDRQDLDLIEEARAIQLVVRERGTGKAAAERLGKTAPWVTQRLNLLKLTDEVQAAVRAGTLPLREVRDWHTKPAEDQRELLLGWRRDTQQPPAPESRPKAATRPAAPRVAAGSVKIRLWGSPGECDRALAAVRHALMITSVVEWRPDRGSPDLGRVYLEVEVPSGE